MPTVTGDNFYIDKHTLQFRTGETGIASIAYDKTDESISITNAGTGQISIGEAGGDIFIGDGSTVTDIVFEQNGSIRALANKTLTLGQSDSDVRVDGQNLIVSGDASFSGSMTINGNPVMTGASDLDTDTLQTVTDRGSTTTNHIQIDNSAGIKIERSSFDAYAQLYPAFSNVPTLMGRGAGGLHLGYESNVSGIRIDTSNNVGIGVTNPNAMLQIGDGSSEATLFHSYDQYNEVKFYGFSDTTDSGVWQFINDGTWDQTRFFIQDANNSSSRLTLHVKGNNGATEILAATSAGNVGIGTTSPSTPLHVKGNIRAEASASTAFADLKSSQIYASSTYDIIVGSNNSLFFRTNDTRRMTILGGGNVGIGSTNPSSLLDLNDGAGGSSTTLLNVGGTGNGRMLVRHIDGKLHNSAATHQLYLNYLSSDHISMVNGGGNVGIGSNTPAYKLDVVDSNGGGLARFKDSDSSHDGIRIEGDTNGGSITNAGSFSSEVIYLQNSANAMRFYTDGTEAVRIDSSQRVGIGTTNPEKHVHIRGSAPYIRLEEDSASNKRLDLYVDPSTAIAYITANQSAQQLSFQTASTDRIRIANDGKVGIGLTDPDQTLDVGGNIRIPNQGKIVFGSAGTTPSDYLQLYDVGAGNPLLKLVQDGAERFSIEGVNGNVYMQGDVGIGITNPAEKLHVHDGHIRMSDGYKIDWGGTNVRIDGDNSSDYFRVFTSSTERLRVNTDGNIAVGQTSPYAPTGGGSTRLTLKRDGNSATNLVVSNQNNGADSMARLVLATYGQDYIIGAQSSVAGAALTISKAASERMRIDSAGNVGIGSNSPTVKLDVNGNIKASQVGVTNIVTNKIVKFGGTYLDDSIIHDDGTNIGIGTSSIDAGARVTIHAQNSNQIHTGLVINSYQSTLATAGNGVGIVMGQNNGVYSSKIANVWTNNNPSYLQTNIAFYTMHDSYAAGSETEKMRLTSQGRLGIGVTNPSERLEVNPDNDSSAIIGRAHVGYMGYGDYAGFSHVDVNATNSFALVQYFNGETYLNTAAGRTLHFQVNNSDAGGFNSSKDFFVDTDTLYVDSTNNRVGIGTSSLIKELQVNGSVLTKNNGGYLSYDAQGNVATILNLTTANELSIGQATHVDSMSFNVGGTDDAIFINSSANVGIGTTSPDFELDVDGDIGMNGKLYHNGDHNTYIGFEADDIKLRVGGTDIVNVDSSKNVGITTNSPTSRLHVYGGDNTGLFGSIRNDFTNRMNMKVAMGSTTRYIGTVQQYGNGDSSGFTVKVYDGAEKVFRIIRVVVQNSGGTNSVSATVEGGGEDTDIHINLEYKNRDGDANKTDFFLVPTSKSFTQYVEIEGFILRDTGWNTTSLTSVSLDTDLALNVLDSVNGSRVGVGTTDPSAKFHAEGSMIVKGDATWAGTDNQNGAIFMNTAGRGLKGAFSTSYARNLILSNANYIDLGEQSSLVYGFRFYAGSASSPVGTYDFYTSGSNSRLHIEKGGNVGIGTTDPDKTLQVGGQVRIDGSTTEGLTITSNAGASRGLELYNNSSTDTASIINYYDGPVLFGQANAEKFRINTDGDLQIAGNGTSNDSFYLYFKNAACGVRRQTNDLILGGYEAIRFRASNTIVGNQTERMCILDDGNVGIGTTNPASLLHVRGSDPVLKITDSSTTTNSATLWLQESDTYGVKINYQSAGGDNGRDYLTIDTLSAADSNNQAGNHDNAWGIDQDGYVMPHKGAVDGNLLKSYEWLLYGSQVSGSTPSFPRNGTDAENSRIYGHNPFGEPAILWYTPSQDSSDNDDGGWNSDTFIIDRGKSYRTSVWVKKTTTNTSDGNLYLGTNYVNNLNGTYNTNPYFINGATMSSVGMENDEWYLFVGYIFDSGHTGTANHPKGGIYDRNGRKLLTAASFKFTDSGSPSDGLSSNFNKSRQRVYNYYDATTGSKTYWWGPRFEPLEASTPTLSEILNSPTSDTGASFMGSVGIGTSTHSQTNETKLHVYKNANRATTIVQNNNHVARFEAYGTATAIDTTASNGVFIRNNTANRVHFDAGGNVGIGCDDPDSRLEVQTSVGSPMLHLRPNAASTALNPIILYRNQLNGSANYMLCEGTSTYFGTYNGGAPTDKSEMIRILPNSSDSPSLRIGDAGSAAANLQVGGNIKLLNNGASYINGGNVGIGTTDPFLKFYVDGNSRVEGNLMVGDASRTNTPQTALHVKSSSTNARIRIEDSDSSNQYWDFYVNQGDALHFNEDTDTRVTFKEGGNVGIGLTDPDTLLEVAGVIKSSSTSRVQADVYNNSANSANIIYRTDRTIVGNNASALVILDGGNVGIGTTNPADTLMIRKDQTAATKLIISNGGTANASTSSRLSFYEGTSEKSYIERRRDGSGKTAFVTPADDNPFVFENAGGEFLRFTNSKVGIGTTNPPHPLSVKGTIVHQNDSNVQVVGITNSNGHGRIYANGGDGVTDILFDSNGTSYIKGGPVAIGSSDAGTASLRIKGDTSDNSTNSLQIVDNANSQLFFVRNDGVVQVTDNYFYVSSTAGAYIQNTLRVRGSIDNDQGTLAINGDVSFDSNTLYVDATSNRIGVGTSDVSNALDVIGTYRISDNNTNSNNKLHRMLGRHYTNAEQDVNIFSSISTSSTNAISFGGGSSSYNTATNIYFYTASNNTSTYAAGQERMRITNAGNIGIGVSSDPSSKLEVNGSFVASSKTFNIEHPTQSGKRLIHGCFEGPEHGVYFRGKSQNSLIEAPEYWSGLVDIDTMTVDVTPIGPNQSIYVDRVEDNGDVYVGANTDEPLNYFYVVYGERKDIEKLELVKDAPVASPNDHID